MMIEQGPYIVHMPEMALTGEEGRALSEHVAPILADGWMVVLDMTECHVVCSHWLSGFYGPLFDRWPLAEVEAAVQVYRPSRTIGEMVDMIYETARHWARLDMQVQAERQGD